MARNNVFDGIYLSCRAYLAQIVSRIVPPDEIEDIVQETYVRACQAKYGGDIQKPRALMATIARNLALDHVKRAENRYRANLETPEQIEQIEDLAGDRNPLRQVISSEEFALFCEAVRLLPVQCRRVFVMKKVYGHSQREIARRLGLSENVVEKHVARGMKLSAQFMRSRLGEQSFGKRTPPPHDNRTARNNVCRQGNDE